MNYCDLLERMMHRDTAAFLEMTDQYGWALYCAIRNKVPNKVDADKIYDETMQRFYRCLQNPDSEDPLEALLCGFAEGISGRQGICSDLHVKSDGAVDLQPPPVQCPMNHEMDMVKTRKRKGRFWFKLCMCLVSVGFLAVIWIGLGLMMEAGLIPYFDLGYSWFSHIAEYLI